MRTLGIYLREGNECVGPFCSREDAERFLKLMELFGESRTGIEIVTRKISAPPGVGKHPRSPRQSLLQKASARNR